jgi:hypothetical protein
MELLAATGSADKHLVEKWDERLKSCQQARTNFERQWYENMAFYAGRQWIVFTKSPNGGFQLSEQAASDKWRVRHVSNRILRIIRAELTKLNKEEPQFYCVPSSTDERDRLAAMAGDAIAEYILRTKYFNVKRLEAVLWTCLCGTGYLKNYYDETQLDLDGQPGKIFFEAVPTPLIFVPNLQTIDIQDQSYVIHARTMEPEAAYATYGVDIKPGTDSTSSIIDSRFLTSLGIKNQKSETSKMCYVKEMWVKPCREFSNGAMFVTAEGKVIYVYEPLTDPESVPNQDMGAPVGFSQGQLPGMGMEQLGMGAPPVGQPPMLPPSINPQQPVGSPPYQEQRVDGYLNPEPEILPPKSTEPGLQDYQYEYPFRHGRYPFVKIDHVPSGMYYSRSVIQDLIPLQKEYNRTRSIMLESRNLAGKPQWGYVTGSIDPKKFNSRPGLLLPVQLGFDFPKALEQPELPPSVVNELEVTIKDMDDVSSQYEITKGRTPPGVEAASAIAYLQEENDTILHHTVVSLEAAVQETGVQVLANVHDFWAADRIVQMTSKNQFMEVKQFKATDLNPIMDFRVESGSMAPRSQAAKQAFITELMKMGVIEPTKALKYLQMAETNKLYDEMMLDYRHAQRENVAMGMGQELTKVDIKGQPEIDPMTGIEMGPAVKQDIERDPMTGEPSIDEETGQPVVFNVTTNPFDNHEIHVQEHEAFQKTQEYELLDPQVQQIIQDHVDQHKMEMMKQKNSIQTDQAMNEVTMGDAKEKKAAAESPPEMDSGAPVGGPSGNGSQPEEAYS